MSVPEKRAEKWSKKQALLRHREAGGIEYGRKTVNNIIIRKETENDYRATEYMTLRAFWNIHEAGCSEHFLVHLLRKADCYEADISRVAEADGRIVGTIMYSKAKVVGEGEEYEVLTFGPLAVEPTCHNRGIGKALLEATIPLARESGYAGIIIFGEPDYYPRHGFVPCEQFGITTADGSNFDAFMAYPLDEGKFSKIHGRFIEDEIFEACSDAEQLARFTGEFPYHKPLTLSCQWLHKERLGQICEIRKNAYIIRFWEEELSGKLKGSFSREKKVLPVVGDYVTFEYHPEGDSMITAVCERRSLLKRADQSGHAMDYVKNMQEQEMAANFDYVFIVTSLNENYNLNRIARYVSITLQGNGIPVVLLTKADLCSNNGRYVREVEVLSDKVRVHTISALYGIGLEELQEYVQPGSTIVLLGSSGVGKSTLVNALAGREIMKTSAIRSGDSKGRHTTTHRQMIPLKNGAVLIDTPGMRELGICDAGEGIDETFSDIAELAEGCRFRDCRHDTEPGCMVKKALEEGTLSIERYRLYRRLHDENDKNAKMTAIAKERKKINQNR